MGSATQQRNA